MWQEQDVGQGQIERPSALENLLLLFFFLVLAVSKQALSFWGEEGRRAIVRCQGTKGLGLLAGPAGEEESRGSESLEGDVWSHSGELEANGKGTQYSPLPVFFFPEFAWLLPLMIALQISSTTCNRVSGCHSAPTMSCVDDSDQPELGVNDVPEVSGPPCRRQLGGACRSSHPVFAWGEGAWKLRCVTCMAGCEMPWFSVCVHPATPQKDEMPGVGCTSRRWVRVLASGNGAALCLQ